MAGHQRLQRVRPEIAEIADFELLRIGEVPNEIRAPVAETDDADADALRSRTVGLGLALGVH